MIYNGGVIFNNNYVTSYEQNHNCTGWNTHIYVRVTEVLCYYDIQIYYELKKSQLHLYNLNQCTSTCILEITQSCLKKNHYVWYFLDSRYHVHLTLVSECH